MRLRNMWNWGQNHVNGGGRTTDAEWADVDQNISTHASDVNDWSLISADDLATIFANVVQYAKG